MKMKSIAIAAIGLAALSFSSCSSENDLTSGIEAQKQAQLLTFSFAIPKADPVTYATHDQAEYDIASLWMYEFDASSGKLLSTPVDIKPQLTGAGPQYSYSKAVTPNQKGTRRFVFVANEQVAGLVVGSSTMADLQQKVTSKTLAADASSATILNDFGSNKRIPMTGEAVANGSKLISVTGTNKSISVEMTRVLARIDISNQITNMVIKDVKLVNANSQSFVFLNGEYTKPATNSKVSGVKTFATIPAAFGKGTELKKAFYLYEGAQPADKKDALQVQISALQNNKDVVFNVPFYVENKPVTVKRNHIYRLVLKDKSGPTDAAGTKISFTIEDTPWNEITLNEEFEALTLVPEIVRTGNFDYDYATATVTLQKEAYSFFNVNAVSNLANAGNSVIEVVGDAPWITKTNQYPFNSEFAISANTTGKVRKAVVKGYYTNYPDVVRYFTIIQKP